MRIAWAFFLLLYLPLAHADVFKPAYLQLKQIDSANYEVLWKVPALDAQTPLKVQLTFPPETQELEARSRSYTAGAISQRWKIRLPGGLEGKAIRFDKLTVTGTDVLVRVERNDGSEQLERILPVSPEFIFTTSPGSLELIITYTGLGFEHILIGIDHLLFVLALLLIVVGRRRLLVTITAFTIAHSITLSLATLNIVHVPTPPVEAIIALSIVFMALEIVRQQQGHNSFTASKPWIVAFTFGLLHGLGFASALSEVGLPENSIPLALLFFNIGVEIGQLVFITAMLLVIAVAKRVFQNALNLQATTISAAYLIGGVSSYWLIERIASF